MLRLWFWKGVYVNVSAGHVSGACVRDDGSVARTPGPARERCSPAGEHTHLAVGRRERLHRHDREELEEQRVSERAGKTGTQRASYGWHRVAMIWLHPSPHACITP